MEGDTGRVSWLEYGLIALIILLGIVAGYVLNGRGDPYPNQLEANLDHCGEIECQVSTAVQ